MGQKINGNSFRLMVNRGWLSDWYADKKYNAYVQEDFYIREYIKKKLNKNYVLGTVFISRSLNNILYIRIFYQRKVRLKQRYLLKRKHRKMVAVLRQFTQSRVKIKFVETFIRQKRKFRLPWYLKRFRFFYWNILSIFFKPDAQLLANSIKHQFDISPRQYQVMNLLKRQVFKKKLFSNYKKSPIIGIKIQFKGRLNGRKRHTSKSLQLGAVPFNTLEIPIQYGQATSIGKAGCVGIKVWIAFKPQKIVKNSYVRTETDQIFKISKKTFKKKTG